MPKDPERITTSPDGRPTDQQPQWRKDFPVDWQQDDYVSRRELVKFIVLTSLAFVTGHFWLVGKGYLSENQGTMPVIPVARVDDLSVGGSRVFHYPNGDKTPRLLIRTGATSFLAYDQQCTHLLCPVIPQVAQGQLHCPCHHGVFDLETGRPIAGPPRRPLTRVTLEVRNGNVYATGLEARTT